MKRIAWSTLTSKSTGQLVTLHAWNGEVLDNQVFLRQQGMVGYQGSMSQVLKWLVDASTSPTWDPPTFTRPARSQTDAVGRNQYTVSSTSPPAPPFVIRRTGIYRVVLRFSANLGLGVPTTAAGPSTGDFNGVLTVNSSIASTAVPFTGPQSNDVLATWPSVSSGGGGTYWHHGNTVRRFVNGDLLRVYCGVLSTGGRQWYAELDLNYLGVST